MQLKSALFIFAAAADRRGNGHLREGGAGDQPPEGAARGHKGLGTQPDTDGVRT